jgi:hypothetical protein
LSSFLSAVTGAGSEDVPLNKFFNHPKKPPPEAAAGTGAGAGAGILVVALGAGASALTGATGAGASGSTPLMTGVCLLVGSCERRVTVVASSISSAIL